MGKGWEKVPPDSARQIGWYRPQEPALVLAVQYDGTNGRAVEFLSSGKLSHVRKYGAYLSTQNWGLNLERGAWVVKENGRPRICSSAEFSQLYRFEQVQDVPGIDDEEDETVAKSESKAIVGDGEAQVAMYTPIEQKPLRAVRFNGENAEEVRAVTGGQVTPYGGERHEKAIQIRNHDGAYAVYKGQWVVRLDDDWTTFAHDEFLRRFRYSGPAEPPEPASKKEKVTIELTVPADMSRGYIEACVRQAIAGKAFGQLGCEVKGA